MGKSKKKIFQNFSFEMKGKLKIDERGLMFRPENPGEFLRTMNLFKILREKGFIFLKDFKKEKTVPIMVDEARIAIPTVSVNFRSKGDHFRAKLGNPFS